MLASAWRAALPGFHIALNTGIETQIALPCSVCACVCQDVGGISFLPLTLFLIKGLVLRTWQVFP